MEYATGNGIASSPAVGADGTIYIGSRDNYLYAVNPTHGALQWKYLTGNMVEFFPGHRCKRDGLCRVSG